MFLLLLVCSRRAVIESLPPKLRGSPGKLARSSPTSAHPSTCPLLFSLSLVRSPFFFLHFFFEFSAPQVPHRKTFIGNILHLSLTKPMGKYMNNHVVVQGPLLGVCVFTIGPNTSIDADLPDVFRLKFDGLGGARSPLRGPSRVRLSSSLSPVCLAFLSHFSSTRSKLHCLSLYAFVLLFSVIFVFAVGCFAAGRSVSSQIKIASL